MTAVPGPQSARDAGRERDAGGRPRNARPRDALGRPLPRGAVGEPRVPDDLSLPPAAALAEAQRLLDGDRPFHAHEVLEASWKSAPAGQRALWKGLAQIAVGITHARRGNARGAAALLRRGGQQVGGYASARPHGIDAAQIAGQAADLAERITRDGLASLAAGELHFRLAGPPEPAGS